jgi:hypothetical protein
LAVAGVEGIIDLSDYKFASDDPGEPGADVYLLVTSWCGCADDFRRLA